MDTHVRDAIRQIRAGIRIDFTTKNQFGEWTEVVTQLQMALNEGGIQQVSAVFTTLSRVMPELKMIDGNEQVYPESVSFGTQELDQVDHYAYHGDIGLAESIGYLWRNRIKYVPGIGWHIWTGSRWINDPCNAIVQYAVIAVRARQVAVNARQVDANDERGRERKALDSKNAVMAERRSRINDALKIAESLPQLVVNADELDSKDHLLSVANGVVDLSSGRLLPSEPDQLITKKTNIPYYPNAKCPRWEKYISEILNGQADLVDYVQRVCGYALTGYTTEQSFWILHGFGGNGKSTFMNVLYAVLGEYGSSAPFATFAAGKDSAVGDDIARLRGQRLVIASENEEGAQLNEARVKSITGGDILTARFLYGSYFEFKPKFKVILSVNHKPIIRGNDRGIWRRVKLIPFERNFEANADLNLEQKLMDELPGILAWFVRGSVAWHERGMQVPDSVKEATDSYKSEMDIIGNFLNDHVILDKTQTQRIKAGDLYQRYNEWASENGLRPMSNPKFSKALQERGLKRERITSGWYWLGISFSE